jgi:DNA replication initiation complex subunit (GINS family)
MYEKIYSVWEKEQKEDTLQRLEDSFYIEAKKFLEALITDKNEPEPLLNKLVKKEYNNISFMLNDLINIRLDKILRSIRIGKELNKEKLLHEEKALYERFKNDLLQLFGEKALPPEVKEIEEKNESFLLIRFLRQLPAIVGSDMKIYGPFQVEDIATLPRENAKALILKKAAKLVHF